MDDDPFGNSDEKYIEDEFTLRIEAIVTDQIMNRPDDVDSKYPRHKENDHRFAETDVETRRA